MDLSLFATLPALILSLCSLSESINETWIIILQNWYHFAITYITIENMYLFSWRFRYIQRYSWIIQNYCNKHIVEAKFRLRCKSWKKKSSVMPWVFYSFFQHLHSLIFGLNLPLRQWNFPDLLHLTLKLFWSTVIILALFWFLDPLVWAGN